MIDQTHHWYALRTRYQSEFKCVEQLLRQGVECFTPWNYTYRRWSDRTKRIQVAMFPQYIFGIISCIELGLLNSCEPHVTIVKRAGLPDPIPTEIIIRLQKLKESVEGYQFIDRPLQRGELVEIVDGLFMGLPAEVIGCKGNRRAFVRLGNSGLILEIPKTHVEPKVTMDK